jgi:hypothetical protein
MSRNDLDGSILAGAEKSTIGMHHSILVGKTKESTGEK